ncbi:methyltransferase domain-containing protein [Novosphingobium sp. FSY-8]|uniref:Methyltransferase domain-containing protein n=1 Tax=Novosphingobium ovatum TaxID=1908523 RepID=A0ABW9XIB2_9SPHN|nr:class I SAM-dependent methyltransferase [Novosphingobium ovatum]NBC38147.1 methyltransferase domain-containing protein [Novosphingobium ovatum]
MSTPIGTHAMLPQANHDEMAEQLFARDLKIWLGSEVEPLQGQLADAIDPGPQHNDRDAEAFARLHEEPAFLGWAGMFRAAQELMWDDIYRSVHRQKDALNAKAAQAADIGSVTIDPDFTAPAYLVDGHVHMMPGGYALNGDDVTQGAVMDRGGAVYMLGRNGGFMNDGRGATVAGHVFAEYPDLKPLKILELGCGTGASIVPVARAFPDAETYGIDVGSSVLRYAHARASHLGVPVHFVQGDAEHAPFEDESFDLVFSAALFHETSETAIPQILAESYRLLKPGGVVVHLEVPARYDQLNLWAQIRAQVERDYNNEPAWQVATSADYDALMRSAGFADPKIGYQDACFAPAPGQGGFGPESKGVFRSWFIASGRK